MVLIFGLKDYCALGFLKGSLMKDPEKLLIRPGEHSRAMRQIRFTDMNQITDLAPKLKTYIQQAVELERSGSKVDFHKKKEISPPTELEEKFAHDPAFKSAFDALTPGRQRGYLIHFANAKQAKTRRSRIERCTEKIFAGKGFNER